MSIDGDIIMMGVQTLSMLSMKLLQSRFYHNSSITYNI